jgi:hypothetical protein
VTVEWCHGRRIVAEQVGDQVRSGCKRPYIVHVDGELVCDRTGKRARRFSTAEAAIVVARSVCAP